MILEHEPDVPIMNERTIDGWMDAKKHHRTAPHRTDPDRMGWDGIGWTGMHITYRGVSYIFFHVKVRTTVFPHELDRALLLPGPSTSV